MLKKTISGIVHYIALLSRQCFLSPIQRSIEAPIIEPALTLWCQKLVIVLGCGICILLEIFLGIISCFLKYIWFRFLVWLINMDTQDIDDDYEYLMEGITVPPDLTTLHLILMPSGHCFGDSSLHVLTGFVLV